MLSRKNIESALAAYAGHKDPAVRAQLRALGPALLAAADARASLAAEVPEWSDEEIAAAAEGKLKLLSVRPVAIDAKRFAEVLGRIAAAMIQGTEAAGAEAELVSGMKAFDFAPYITEPMLALAGRDPLAYLEKADGMAGQGALTDLFVFPALGLALRTFLDAAADEASRRIEPLLKNDTHLSRPLRCPVCGSEAEIAAVEPTAANGNVKRLYCECCGAGWLFERIRCAHCGNEAVSDFDYVHDEDDLTHRLHRDRRCGASVPTVFPKSAEGFCPEVESIVMAGLFVFSEGQKDAA